MSQRLRTSASSVSRWSRSKPLISVSLRGCTRFIGHLLTLGGPIIVHFQKLRKIYFDLISFDAVIDESVSAFVQDKQKALSEYVRAAKPGGYVGLNEVTWVKLPPPELVRYTALIMAGADFLTAEGWQALLDGAGLGELGTRQHRFDARSQYVEELRQLDVREYLGAWYRLLTQSVTNPAYRKFMKEVMSAPGQIFKFIKNIGYGIYVGRKLN